MTISKAKKECNARYVSKLDQLKIQPLKEEGEAIRQAAADAGQSVQAYILQAIRERMARDNGK